MSVVERIYICPRTVSKDDLSAEKEAIVSDFDSLVFENIPCSDSSNINYNDGQEADPFDKIAKYYGRQKNVFQFISLLRNAEFSALILNKIKGKCSTEQFDSFIERATLYLARIKQGEITAREFLNGDHFPDAFFNGYHCGEMKNFHENLNVNFTQSTQYLDVQDIFTRQIDCRESGELLRVKIFENGLRAVSIEKDQDARKYSFSKNAACQLVLKNDRSSLYLDIIAGKVANVEREVGGVRATLAKVSEVPDELINYSEILINLQSLKEVLLAYFDEKCMLDERDWFVQEQCLPIKTFEDLENWKPAEHQHVTERLLRRKKAEGPKTLVCHDMRGGYLDDRYVNGTKVAENYYFAYWQNVDTFVYFSHNFVTIPPCTWISAAHRNGVRILGTFITEWSDGEEICNKFLNDEKSAYALASRLVNIAKLCNFEGWLINIENKLKPHQIPVLKKFLSFLTSKMSSFCSDSQVIWYDSVIKNGELKWQNALNENNRMFFNACDGIFLNYNWKEENLAASLKSAAERQTDVYVGVDVFGRGCLGGGGFATDVAVAEARKFGLSVAIFAPGWVHECNDVKEFRGNQFTFWSALQKYCPARTITEFPRTSFCLGFGWDMFRNMEFISKEPWHNLGLQSLQPIYSEHLPIFSENIPVGYFYACNGGTHISYYKDMDRKDKSIMLKFFETDLNIKGELIVSYTCDEDYKNETSLVLQLKNGSQLHLVGKNHNVSNIDEYCFPSSEEELLKKGYNKKKSSMWTTRTYLLNRTEDNIQSISVKYQLLDKGIYYIDLKVLEMIPLWPIYNLIHRNLTCNWDADRTKVRVQCVLEWQYQTSVLYSDLYVKVPGGEKKYLGTTSQLNFKLDHTFDKVESFNVILSPKGALKEDLGSETMRVNIA